MRQKAKDRFNIYNSIAAKSRNSYKVETNILNYIFHYGLTNLSLLFHGHLIKRWIK